MGPVSSIAAVKMKLKTNSKNKENSEDYHLRTSAKQVYYFWNKIRNVYSVDEHKIPQRCV